MTIVALPLVFGSFGAAWDIMAYVWIRGEVQSSLDGAVAAGATTATTGEQGRLVFVRTDYMSVVRQAYAMNRPIFLKCAGSSGASCWKTPDGAPKVTRAPETRELQIAWTVSEDYDTAWLSFLGIDSLGITAQSQATLSSTTGR